METVFSFNPLLNFGKQNSALSNLMDELMKEFNMFTDQSSTQNEEYNEIVSEFQFIVRRTTRSTTRRYLSF